MRIQFTHVYVQKSISTTLPRSRCSSRVNGSELIQFPVSSSSGASPTLTGTAVGSGGAPVGTAALAGREVDVGTGSAGTTVDGEAVAVAFGSSVAAG